MIEISRFLRVVCYFLIIIMPLTSWALSFTVTNTNDSGDGSLRQAVADAVLSPSDDTIEFAPGLTGQTFFLTSGAIHIGDDFFDNANITINGLGADNLTISGSNSSPVFIVNDDSQLALNGVTITDTVPSAIKVDGRFSSTKLTLTNCTITNNHGSDSGFPNAAIASTGEVEVDNCTISSNTGAGIDVSLDRLKVTNSTITDNGSGINGGTSVFEDDNGGISMFVSDSTVSSNRGDGVSATEGHLSIFNSTITNNDGAAVSVDLSGHAEINESTLTNNNRGIAFFGEHVNEDIGNATASLTVTNSTISGNTGEENGGGILVENLADTEEDPVEMTVTLNHTTVTNNSATEQGGGILVMPDPVGATTTVTVNNSIIAGNGASASLDVAGNFISNGFNIIGDIGASSGFESDIIEADVNKILDTVLNDNGGPTKTHLLVTDSPAIDTAFLCPPPATDQRGISRPQGADCDIGAVEIERDGEPPIEVLQCDTRTDYESGSCSGKFNASSLADLEAYKASNFGKEGRENYRNLVIKADIGGAGDILDIESPCEIIVNNGVNLAGDFVSLDGRKGVWSDTNINSAGAACLLSENGRVKLKSDSSITARRLVVQGNKIVKIGKNTQVSVGDSLTVQSTGSTSASRAIIDKGANLLVGSNMILESGFRAVIQNDAVIDVTGGLEMNAKTKNDCLVKNSAEISYGSKLGVCAEKLP